MKKYEVIIPKKISFTEHQIHIIEAESEEEALAIARQNHDNVEYDNQGDYADEYEYEDEIEIIEITNEERN